jgi:hypothetical protein
MKKPFISISIDCTTGSVTREELEDDRPTLAADTLAAYMLSSETETNDLLKRIVGRSVDLLSQDETNMLVAVIAMRLGLVDRDGKII